MTLIIDVLGEFSCKLFGMYIDIYKGVCLHKESGVLRLEDRVIQFCKFYQKTEV